LLNQNCIVIELVDVLYNQYLLSVIVSSCNCCWHLVIYSWYWLFCVWQTLFASAAVYWV